MTFIQVLILAIIEGLTEFLPVSSTGHIIIGSSLMGIAQQPFVKDFTVIIQFGAILAVVVAYWKRFFKSFDFYYKLAIGVLPALVIGFLINDFIESILENVLVVAVTLILGGLVLLKMDEWFAANESSNETEPTIKQSFTIGFFQVIAMIPGVSRSGATIFGGMMQGLNKKTAAEFSFFLAVPTMFAATCYKLLKIYKLKNGFPTEYLNDLVIGNIIAFVVALVAIRYFIAILIRYGFKIFGWYRIVVGLVILLLHFMGVSLHIL